MLRLLRVGRSFLIFMIVVPLMIFMSFIIYLEYIQTKEDVFKIIKEHLIDEKLQLFDNYSKIIVEKFGDNLKDDLQNNEQLCIEYENRLRLIEGKEIKYLYLLYRDENAHFRFLLDATLDVNEKSELNQRFHPQTDIWDEAYSTAKVQIIHQEELELLWVSVAYPVVLNGKVIAVIGADFTYDVYTQILNILDPLESLYLYVSLFMLLMLTLAIALLYLYYKIRKKSFLDPLTKVYNRQYLSEFLDYASLKDYHLMMIDLDFFKLVNDNYGHNAGDEVLMIISQKINNLIRKEDVLIRFGGEEFLLLIYKQNLFDSITIANRIRTTIMKHTIHANNHQINITLSIGVNPFPYRAKNIEEAIKIADEQLYIAKSSGRNRVEVFQNEEDCQSTSSKRISDIQLAIDEDRIKCAYQPIYSNKSKKIDKYEMLIRLIDKNGDIITPNEFLPSIRNTQVYIKLTSIVLNTAIKTLNETDYQLSMNLDIQDILNNELIMLFKTSLKNKPELAARLTVEILEHEEILNFELVKKRIKVLENLGLKIALDDFGSGFANFRYLLDLDIDILKIDGSLIKNIDQSSEAYFMVKSIVDFTKNMNMATVAEHVETKEEFEVLSELGVDYMQGFYLGRPSFDFEVTL